MSEHNVLERNGEVFHGVESPPSVSDPREPGVEFDQQDVTARARLPQEEPAARAPASTYPPEAVRPQATDREHGPASSVAAPLSPRSAPCSSPPRSPAATSTWTTQDILNLPMTPSSRRGSSPIAPKVSGLHHRRPGHRQPACRRRRRDRPHR